MLEKIVKDKEEKIKQYKKNQNQLIERITMYQEEVNKLEEKVH